MNRHPFLDEYQLARIITTASAAAFGSFFPAILLLFLSSQTTSHHPPFNTDTIGEMIGYTEYFFFVIAAYFGSAVLIWNSRGFWSQFVPAWFPISVIGSFVFCFTFFTRVWVEAVYSSNVDSSASAGSFLGLLGACFIVSFVLSISSGIFASVSMILLPTGRIKPEATTFE